MVGIFRQKNATNALVLLVYGLVLKFFMFLHPVTPVLLKGDNYLYRFLLQSLDLVFHQAALPYSILAFFLLFTQATLFNSIFNFHRLLPRSSYLGGMAYLLLTSLLPEWNHFSAPLLVNSVMIWSVHRMLSLYNHPRPIAAVFNIGLLTGIASLLYIPAIAFILLVFFSLLIMRPFRPQEWVVGLLGFTTPYYFLVVVLYFTNQLHWRNVFPGVLLTLPALPESFWIILGLACLVLPFIVGGIFVQNNLNKMLIHSRKSWSLLLVFMITSVVVILLNEAGSYENWIVSAVPFAGFHAAAYYYPGKKTFPLWMHWISVAAVLLMHYLPR